MGEIVVTTSEQNTAAALAAAGLDPQGNPLVVATPESEQTPATDTPASDLPLPAANSSTQEAVQDASLEQPDDTDELGEAPGDDPRTNKSRGYKLKAQRERERAERAEAALEEARRLLDAERQQRTQPDPKREDAPGKPQETSARPQRPKPEEFDTNEAYEAAIDKYETDRDAWNRKQIREELKAEQQKAAARTEQEKAIAAFDATVEKTRAEHPDYDDVIQNADGQLQAIGITIPTHLAVEILKSSSGAALQYALAKDPKVLAQLCGLDAMATAREIGRWEARLETATAQPKAPKPPPAPRTPAPLRPLTGLAGGDGAFDPNTADQAAYEAKRKAGWGR